MKHILYKEQYVGLILLACAIAYGFLYGLGFLPQLGLYIAFGTIIVGLLIFLVPLISGPMKKGLRAKLGQQIFDFFDRAGMKEKDMRKLVALAKEGYKIGFSQPNTPPYIAVMLTVKKFAQTEVPSDDDYLPWEEAIKIIESNPPDMASEQTVSEQITCPICGKTAIDGCEPCGWKPT